MFRDFLLPTFLRLCLISGWRKFNRKTLLPINIPECVVLILRTEKCGKLDVPVIFVWSKAPQASRKRWQQTTRKQTQAPHNDVF